MTLSAGTHLGAYQITSLLGVGGMGEVYRAHDRKLGRDVALKILPAAFRSDADRLSRFEREARALAALNHRNIATIHGLEEHHGIHALVLELVEGQTLAEMIAARRRLAIGDALAIARGLGWLAGENVVAINVSLAGPPNGSSAPDLSPAEGRDKLPVRTPPASTCLVRVRGGRGRGEAGGPAPGRGRGSCDWG